MKKRICITLTEEEHEGLKYKAQRERETISSMIAKIGYASYLTKKRKEEEEEKK